MNSNRPLISVIMPAYNAGRFIAEAVGSINRQNYPALEIVIVDDGSTDGTAGIVKGLGPNVRFFSQANGGPAAARNRGIREARGEVIAFLDTDDLWPEDKLAIQMPRLYETPVTDIVLGRIRYVSLPGIEVPDMHFEGPDQTVTHVHLGSGVYRKSVFDRVGRFDESLRFSEDVDWFLRVRECGINMIILKETTLLYRVHGDNMSINKTMPELQVFKVLKKSLDRRRLQGNGKAGHLKHWSEFDEAQQKGTKEGS